MRLLANLKGAGPLRSSISLMPQSVSHSLKNLLDGSSTASVSEWSQLLSTVSPYLQDVLFTDMSGGSTFCTGPQMCSDGSLTSISPRNGPGTGTHGLLPEGRAVYVFSLRCREATVLLLFSLCMYSYIF